MRRRWNDRRARLRFIREQLALADERQPSQLDRWDRHRS